MSKFKNIDDAIRNSVENHEVPFDAAQWDAINQKLNNSLSNDLTSLDKKVKESLNNHSYPYNAEAWTAVESQLGNGFSYTKWIVAAGIVGLISTGIYFFSGDNDNKRAEKEITTEQSHEEKLTAVNKTENAENNLAENNSTSEKTNTENIVEPDVEDNFEPDEILPESFLGNPTVTNYFGSNGSNNGNNNQTDNNSNTQNNNSSVTVNDNTNQLNAGPVQWSFDGPQIIGKTNTICEGTELKLTSSDFTGDVSVAWLMDGMEIGNLASVTLKNISAGTHTIELVHSAKNNIASCKEPVKKAAYTIEVLASPAVDFAYEMIGDASYPEMQFNVMNPDNNVSYAWMMNDRTFNGKEAVYLFNNKGNYPVQLKAESKDGCIAYENQTVDISNDYNLLAPNAFTPNGDNNNNDFIPEALKVLNLPFKMTIFDRQQRLVYQTARADAPWDGRNMSTGEQCSMGAYVWIVKLTNKKGEVETYSGTITLLK